MHTHPTTEATVLPTMLKLLTPPTRSSHCFHVDEWDRFSSTLPMDKVGRQRALRRWHCTIRDIIFIELALAFPKDDHYVHSAIEVMANRVPQPEGKTCTCQPLSV